MSRIAKTTAILAGMIVSLGLVALARAADKPDPTGTWKWSTTVNDQKRETTLKLKLEGDKLSGTISGRNNTETAIENPTYKDGDVAFEVTRERNGQKFTRKFSGKVTGDTLKGKVTFTRDGKEQSTEFEAKRETAK